MSATTIFEKYSISIFNALNSNNHLRKNLNLKKLTLNLTLNVQSKTNIRIYCYDESRCASNNII